MERCGLTGFGILVAILMAMTTISRGEMVVGVQPNPTDLSKFDCRRRNGCFPLYFPRKEQDRRMAGHWSLIAGGKRKWQSTLNLTYAFSSTIALAESPILSQDDIRSAMAAAFKTWAAVIPLGFRETEKFEEAQIKIEFVGGEHGDGMPFDGVLGFVSHAFAPEDGRFHLDIAETWTTSMLMTASSSALDLETVALHEIGHLIGLDHSALPHSVMFPILLPRFTRRRLTHDDIMGATALYGVTGQAPLSISQSHSYSSHHLQDSFSFVLLLMLLLLLLV